jgi:hypothetical protein
MKKLLAWFAPHLLIFCVFFGLTEAAFAVDVVTEATTALTSAKADAQSIGGLIVAAVAVLAVVGLILSMLRKA